MKKNFNASLKELDGKVMYETVGLKKEAQGKPRELITESDVERREVTLKSLVCSQLMNSESVKKEDKVKAYNLALKIYNSKGEIEVQSEDITLIKECILSNEKLPALIAGQAIQLIEK